MPHTTRQGTTSRFTRVVRLTPEHYEKIKNIKSKKSIAGKLECVIELFLENQK